jgi:uncharacterized protein (TIGR03083 family)
MKFPGEHDLRVERALLVETLASLTDEEFESGPTLCEGWAPRDVLAHLLGSDTQLYRYVLALGRVDKANAQMVDAEKGKSRARLERRAEHWAAHPAPLSRPIAGFLLGDVAIHHQDVLRALGRRRVLPQASADAVYREGAMLGFRTLLTHRAVPLDGARPLGRGAEVRGTREALGMWLAGRAGIESELEFAAA